MTSSSKVGPDDIVSYWFASGMAERWFKKDPAFDEELRERFAEAHEAAAAGAFDGWAETATGSLALCLLLDQMPRNLFRDDPRAYATDAQARAVARAALDRGFDRTLPQDRRLFLYLPFEHAETLDDQELCVALVAGLDEYPDWLQYAEAHRDIVARFGRFPHRNATLGRTSTDEELAFLKEPGSSF